MNVRRYSEPQFRLLYPEMKKPSSRIKKAVTKSRSSTRAKAKNRVLAKAKAVPNRVASFAHLVMDPCEGPIERRAGISTQGAVVERQRSTLTFPAVAAQNCGYLVWFPSYHGPAGSQNANLYYWSTTDPSVQPANTATNPMGTTLATTGLFLADPTSSSIPSTSAFTRARCVSACMQLDFIGSLANTAGQVAVVRNLSLSAFNMSTGTTGPFQPMSVDQMFSYAHTRERINLDGHEVVWRPTDTESVLRTNGQDPAVNPFEPDCCFLPGVPTVNATALAVANQGNVTGVAICWRGTTATANFLTANFVKVAELELAPRNNLTEMVPRPVPGGRTTFAEVTDYLDRVMPDWQARSIRHGQSIMKSTMETYAPRLADLFRTTMNLT